MIENYLDILADSLQKKSIVLDKIEDENNKQAKMLKSDSFPYIRESGNSCRTIGTNIKTRLPDFKNL